ncbi:N-acetylmuramoyl-L-alanine amidase [Pseudomonadota bacterium]
MFKKCCKVTLLFFLIIFFNITNLHAENNIVDFRGSAEGNRIRLVLETSEKPEFNVFTLQSPSRLVIDLKNSEDKYKLTNFKYDIIKSVRISKSSNNDLRVVFDLEEKITLNRSFVLNPSDLNKNYRLVIDFIKSSIKPKSKITAEHYNNKGTENIIENSRPTVNSILEDMGFDQDVLGSLISGKGILEEEEGEAIPLPSSIRTRSVVKSGRIFEPIIMRVQAKKKLAEEKERAIVAKNSVNDSSKLWNKNTVAKNKNNRNRSYVSYNDFSVDKSRKPIIIIDAGHGGRDPGAIGVRRTKEKFITLMFAKALKKDLEKTGKYKVYLTRNGDYFISLGGRVKKAQKLKADLFISLHADSNRNRKAKGLSVYTLSERASDEKAAALARKENKADIISGANFKGEYEETIKILIDLSRRDTMNSSTEFAEIAVDELQKRVKLLQNTHRYAGFAVLTAPDVPSTLIELGFLSNKSDERMLKTSAYRKKVNYGLQKAIERYFRKKGFFYNFRNHLYRHIFTH